MKRILWLILLLLPVYALLSQNKQILKKQDLVQISKSVQDKILSGLLIEKVSEKQIMLNQALDKSGSLNTKVILYLPEYPSGQELQALNQLGIEYFMDTWTPPLTNHKYGYMIATLPVEKFNDALSLQFIKKMDTAERISTALNNNATQSVKANLVWDAGYEGSNIKIGILDSGIDLGYAGTDLPASFDYKDYSDYPNLDDDVANKVTGHGTHVAGSALGRGLLSEGHSHVDNGQGAFKGSAPKADMVFLKIGNDSTASASDASIIAAIDAAVSVYGVNILSMSYGGWNDYHDGSSALEQKVDWAYYQGIPFFCSAGNSADENKHWSGNVTAHSETDFINIQVTGAGNNNTMLRFNLDWFDGNSRNDLTLKYYNNSKELLSEVTWLPTTESVRGTESQYSYYNNFVPSGNGTYYIKVVNNSDNDQYCHLFEDWANQENGTNNVVFADADAYYTIGSPAAADHAFAVGAYVSRTIWSDYQGNSWWYGASYELNNIALFSSKGPRVDGLIKPDICAPGHVLISLRDNDVYTLPDKGWIDNDGIIGNGGVDYYRMRGTSMACPIVAGAAALYLENLPGSSPQQVYDAFKNFSNTSGLTGLPDNTWGAGRLDAMNALNIVNLLSPYNEILGLSSNPTLQWNPKDGALSYNIQVAASEDFSSLVINKTDINVTFIDLTSLAANTTYYWRVSYNYAGGSSGWSGKWHFTTGGKPTEAGYALWYDGVNDYVSIPHSSVMDEIEDSDVITIEAWVKIDKWSADVFPIIEKYMSNIDWGWSFSLHNSAGMDLGMIWSGVSYPAVPPLNTWTHVAVSYNKADGKARFFMNGVLKGEPAFSGDIPDTQPTDPLQIGFNASGGDEYASGMIDELRIWKVTRTEQEIQDNMYKKMTGTELGLAAVFSFDEGMGSSIYDLSGNHGQGSLVDFPIWMVSTIPYRMPDAPVLAYPQNDAANVSLKLLFKWNQSPAAATYHFQLSAHSDFTDCIYDDSTITTSSFQSDSLLSNTTYYWRVNAKNIHGFSDWSQAWSFNTTLTGINDKEVLPDQYYLFYNYPNPFNPTTKIGLGIPEKGNVRLSVLNILGEEIRVLLNEEKEAGYHSIDFNAKDLPSGVYFYRIKSGNFIDTKKMILLK